MQHPAVRNIVLNGNIKHSIFVFLMKLQTIALSPSQKIYFASDFHLGVPTHDASLERERKIIAWLEMVRHDAHSIYLLGDIFDFWFEYRQTIPKGFIRFQGKLAELCDAGIPIYFFTGNHDMWMFDYFPKELGIPIYREPILLNTGSQRLIIGHGDGLGPGETGYKILKSFFDSKVCQWLFARIHPNLGMSIATYWSKKSRINNMKTEEKFHGDEKEFLLLWCREQEKISHHDFYVFGHRHLPLDLKVSDNSRYVNIGEWVNGSTYGVYDGNSFELKNF
ncbi:UDP-2,3-diacylglucosamine diphosphatase [soil metagenome]